MQLMFAFSGIGVQSTIRVYTAFDLLSEMGGLNAIYFFNCSFCGFHIQHELPQVQPSERIARLEVATAQNGLSV
jgi:hypothetical protein